MFRKLATLVLAVPLLLNGLWMVCAGGEPKAPNPAVYSAESGEKPHCTTTMCATEKARNDGPICLLTSDENKVLMTILVFGVAVVPGEVGVPQPLAAGQATAVWSSFYISPNIPFSPPPPEA